MKKFINIVRSRAGILIGAVVALAAGSFSTAAVLAAIPDGSGVIHACYKTGTTGPTGTSIFHIIDSAETTDCPGDEAALTWNQQGPKGDKGDKGDTGAAGGSGFVSDLTSADFSNIDLRYRTLAGQNLTNATFAQANLRRVSFSATNLTGVNFTSAVLSGVDFSNADLTGAIFATVNDGPNGHPAHNVNFSGANYNDADFTHAAFDTVSLPGFKLDHRQVSDISLTHANLTNADFSHSEFVSGINGFARFDDSNLTGADLTDSHFTGTNFNVVNFTNANLTNVVFGGGGYDISLYGSDFTGANLSGVTWQQVTCPDGTLSQDHDSTCIDHLTPAQ